MWTAFSHRVVQMVYAYTVEPQLYRPYGTEGSPYSYTRSKYSLLAMEWHLSQSSASVPEL